VGEVCLRSLRILIAYEESHRLYGYALESAIKARRPHLVVEIADEPEAFEAEVERLDPHLVISNRPNTVNPGGRVAWLRLSHEPDEESEICLDGETSGLVNPGLEELLRIIDQTEELMWTGRNLGGC
jgi:hypothetical protein